jgi:hypothetical protein
LASQDFDGGNMKMPFQANSGNTVVMMPFWAWVNQNTYYDAGGDTLPANTIYYRLMSVTDVQYEPSLGPTFARVNADVAAYFAADGPFSAVSVLIETWYRVHGSFGYAQNRENVFQLVLASDSQRTYLFYLYRNMTWSLFPPSSYSYGVGAPSYAQFGIDPGDHQHWYPLPGSGTYLGGCDLVSPMSVRIQRGYGGSRLLHAIGIDEKVTGAMLHAPCLPACRCLTLTWAYLACGASVWTAGQLLRRAPPTPARA